MTKDFGLEFQIFEYHKIFAEGTSVRQKKMPNVPFEEAVLLFGFKSKEEIPLKDSVELFQKINALNKSSPFQLWKEFGEKGLGYCTVQELKDELLTRDLKLSGTKPVLIARLKSAWRRSKRKQEEVVEVEEEEEEEVANKRKRVEPNGQKTLNIQITYFDLLSLAIDVLVHFLCLEK